MSTVSTSDVKHLNVSLSTYNSDKTSTPVLHTQADLFSQAGDFKGVNQLTRASREDIKSAILTINEAIKDGRLGQARDSGKKSVTHEQLHAFAENPQSDKEISSAVKIFLKDENADVRLLFDGATAQQQGGDYGAKTDDYLTHEVFAKLYSPTVFPLPVPDAQPLSPPTPPTPPNSGNSTKITSDLNGPAYYIPGILQGSADYTVSATDFDLSKSKNHINPMVMTPDGFISTESIGRRTHWDPEYGNTFLGKNAVNAPFGTAKVFIEEAGYYGVGFIGTAGDRGTETNGAGFSLDGRLNPLRFHMSYSEDPAGVTHSAARGLGGGSPLIDKATPVAYFKQGWNTIGVHGFENGVKIKSVNITQVNPNRIISG